jgi:hypothetical protein
MYVSASPPPKAKALLFFFFLSSILSRIGIASRETTLLPLIDGANTLQLTCSYEPSELEPEEQEWRPEVYMRIGAEDVFVRRAEPQPRFSQDTLRSSFLQISGCQSPCADRLNEFQF